MAGKLDPRLHAYRPDLADVGLRDSVAASTYVEGHNCQILTTTPLRTAPSHEAPLGSEGLGGEMVQVFEIANGWAWIQLQRDRYVGYVESETLTQSLAFTTHYISAPTALVFPKPDIKVQPSGKLFLGSEVVLAGEDAGFVQLESGGFVYGQNVRALGDYGDDFVSLAERFVGTPYMWGGKTADGLDCSGLVQICLQAAGEVCLRDSDMQLASIGVSLGSTLDLLAIRRGDLIFWKGHVGIMTDPEMLLHSNVHHMETAAEPLADVIARIEADAGPVLAVRRLACEAPIIGALVEEAKA